VPPPLSAIIARLLAKNPDDRYPSAAAALHEIETLRTQLFPGDDAVEDISPSAALPLSAAVASESGAGRGTQPSVTAITNSDLTPALSGPRQALPFDRPISTPLFVGVIAALVLLLGGSALAIRLQTSRGPAAVLSAVDLQRFEEKRIDLAAARGLYSSGDYAAAVKAYDQFIAKYPESIVALEERAEAQLALQAKTKDSAVSVDVSTKRAKTAPPKKPAEEKRPWWRRLGRG
jgi:TolA-binding protein